MFTAAIFDMDGLLIDSERAFMEAWIGAARRLSLALSPEDYAAVIGLTDAESDAVLSELLGGATAFAAVRAEVHHYWAARPDPAEFALMPGAHEVLSALREAGVPCAVASSTGAADVRARLGRAGLLSHFTVLASGDEVPRGKPDPAVYRLALQRIGLPPHACVAFEDSAHGACAALDAGLQVVLVPGLRAPPPALRERSLRIFDSLADAIVYLPAWFPPSGPAPVDAAGRAP